jgi:hypothetical protein
LHHGEVLQGIGFAEPVADVAVQRPGLLQPGRGGRVVAGELCQEAQLLEGVGFGGLVVGTAGQR